MRCTFFNAFEENYRIMGVDSNARSNKKKVASIIILEMIYD